MHLSEITPFKSKVYNKGTVYGDKVEAGKSYCLVDYKGAGQVSRIQITNKWDDPLFHRKALLKVYWDGEEYPSILCPVGDFFCDAFCGKSMDFTTEYFGKSHKLWYCYLPMPFEKGCRIEIENQSDVEDACFTWVVTIDEWPECPPEYGRLHACWRRQNPTQPGVPYTILDTNGKGRFLGCNLSVQSLGAPSLSFLEGLAMVYVDGQPDPVLKVWGTEDFCGGSFYFSGGPYAGPYSGCTYINEHTGQFAGYRLFIKDAITFQSSIKVMVNHGESFKSGPIASYEGHADYSSVAYWYQTEPHDQSIYQGQSVEDRLPLKLRLVPSTPSTSSK